MWNKIKEFFINLFRRTQFDNTLFKEGVNAVKKELKKVVKPFADLTMEELFDYVVQELYKEFGHIKLLRKLLDEAIAFALERLENLNCKCTLNKRIDKIAEAVIDFYNSKL